MFACMASAVDTLSRPELPPLVVIYQPVASLVPDPRNARTHPKRQVEQIAASIRAFGFANPILVDGVGGIIAGHGRLLAAKLVGLAEVPTIVLPHLSEAQQRALRLADNKIALGAGWDVEILKLELADLAVLDVDFDLSLTGFSAGEIDVVLQGQADPDDELIPAVPATPRTRSTAFADVRVSRQAHRGLRRSPCPRRLCGTAQAAARTQKRLLECGMTPRVSVGLLSLPMSACDKSCRSGLAH